jgi:SAM-dependent methyltransferase
MFIEESLCIKETLSNLNLTSGNDVLDIGSSTTQFRQVTQPHIDKNIFYPLRQQGCQVYHMDMKQGDGVDIVCDIADPNIDPLKCIGMRFELVVCANLLEHVLDLERVVRIVVSLVKTGGYLLITVPRSYRKHPDPIDNMFRPLPGKLEQIFRSIEPAMATTASKVIGINERRYYPVHESHWPLWGRRDVLRYWFPWARWKVSCILLHKRE